MLKKRQRDEDQKVVENEDSDHEILNKENKAKKNGNHIKENGKANGKVELKEKNIKNKDVLQDEEEPEDDFSAFNISPEISNKLKEKSINTLFEVQKKVFKVIYDGTDMIAASLTGSGKTLSFVLPTLQRNKDLGLFKHKSPRVLVMAPTRELAIQVGREFSTLSSTEFPFRTVMVYGGVSLDDQSYKLSQGCDIVVGTPGRILDMIDRGKLTLKQIKTVILDEADKMLSMGFQENIEEIFKKIYEQKGNEERVQVCLFSATIESWVKQVAGNIMKTKPTFIDLVKDLAGRTPKTVQHLAVNCLKSDRVTTIADLILCYGGKNKATIVFVNTKRECNDLMISDKIKQEVQIIHGDINQKQREATIEGFKKGKFKCLIATDVASRGLDIPMVDLVIQSEPQKEVDTYIHRAGRTARAGRSGVCITLYTKVTEELIRRIENKCKFKFKKIGAPQKNEIIEASARDISSAISEIDDSMINLFKTNANELINEYTAEIAIARLLAYVSGHTEKLKSRSLIVGAEGFVTYQIKTPTTFQHAGFIWSLLKRVLTEEYRSKIRGVRQFKTQDGAVFDFPEDGHKEFEEMIFNDRLHGTSYTLSKPEQLPELIEEKQFNNNNSFNNGFNRGGNNNNNSFNRSQSNGRSQSRAGRFDIFIGNLPSAADQDQIKTFIANNGIVSKDLDVRLVFDKDTGSFKGFSFVSTFDKGVYDKLLTLNGKMYMNRSLRVNDAASKSK